MHKAILEGTLAKEIIKGTEDEKKRRKQLLDDLKEQRSSWNLKEEALGHALWRTRFGRGCEPSQDRLCNDEICIFDVTEDFSAQKVTTTCLDLSVVDLELKIDEEIPGRSRI
jgi:hypothetical protein